VDGESITLCFEGATRVDQEGEWTVDEFADIGHPTPQRRGFDARLAGRARFDATSGRFSAFDLVAAGMRWGGTAHNRRISNFAPAPMGVALSLLRAANGECIQPAFLRKYEWLS
jgi:hypothetical protein